MKKTILTLTVALGALTTFSHADTSWKKKVQPYSVGTHKKLAPIKLNYEMSWKGLLNAGNVTFEFNKKDKRYPAYDISQASGKSAGIAYATFPYNFSMTSFTKKSTQKPALFIADEKDKKEKIHTQNKFTSRGVVHNSSTLIRATKKTEVKKHTYAFSNSHDALSALQYIRRQPLKNGDKVKLSLHPFASPMYAEITVLGREKHNGVACIKLDVKLQKIDLTTMNLKAYKKLKKATLWISDDADRIMTELRSAVFIGDVRMVLKSKKKL